MQYFSMLSLDQINDQIYLTRNLWPSKENKNPKTVDGIVRTILAPIFSQVPHYKADTKF